MKLIELIKRKKESFDLVPRTNISLRKAKKIAESGFTGRWDKKCCDTDTISNFLFWLKIISSIDHIIQENHSY